MSAPTEKVKVPVTIRASYKKSEILSLQVWINGVEQKLVNDLISLDLQLETIYYLRWYIAGENGAKVTFRIIIPKKMELRYPFVPLNKTKPEVEATIGKHPLIRDTSGDQRFYLLDKKGDPK